MEQKWGGMRSATKPAGEEMFVHQGFADANAAVNIDAFPQGPTSMLPFWLLA